LARFPISVRSELRSFRRQHRVGDRVREAGLHFAEEAFERVTPAAILAIAANSARPGSLAVSSKER